MSKRHFIESYLSDPDHKVTVNLIGCGGTGSQVLTCLARMNEAMVGLGHPGIHVCVHDGDTVSESNVGRQMFGPADVGYNKAITLITRVNRYFGYEWIAQPSMYDANTAKANITISCVDTAAARLDINKSFSKNESVNPVHESFYWMDFGNSKKTGQVVLGTIKKIDQPTVNNTAFYLPTVVRMFPELKKVKDDNEPSCSIAQALGKQDLFINSTLAQLGMALLWKLFREGNITQHGLYLNLETMACNPIMIK